MTDWTGEVKETHEETTKGAEVAAMEETPTTASEAKERSTDPLSITNVMYRDAPPIASNSMKHPRSIIDDDDINSARKKDKKMQKRAPFPHTTYEMINNCDPDIAAWTSNGEMFVVKDPDLFAKLVIPEYFDHSKFESFTRQLNFYGFNKVESKVMRIKDIDQRTINHVTFFNEFFKRNRKDLLSSIQRSTNRGKSQTNHIETLEAKLTQLSHEVHCVHLQLASMENLKKRIVSLESKLGHQNHLESNLILSAENETTAEYLHMCKSGTHTPPNANKINDESSSECMQFPVRRQSVGFCDDLDPPAKTSRYLSELRTTSMEGDSALRLLSEISNERKLDESMNTHNRLKSISDQHYHTVHQSKHSIAHRNSPGATPHDPESLVQYDPSTRNIDLIQTIDGYENNISHTSIAISDKTSLKALQSGISKFWETLTREENRT